VSDGTASRWLAHPAPSFINLSALPRWRKGTCCLDLVAIKASVDIVMGEVDR